MLQILILLVFAYAQDSYGNYPAYIWAVMYGVVMLIGMMIFGLPILPALITGVLLGLYSWGYFGVLRRCDNTVVWLAVCVFGLLIPFVFGLLVPLLIGVLA